MIRINLKCIQRGLTQNYKICGLLLLFSSLIWTWNHCSRNAQLLSLFTPANHLSKQRPYISEEDVTEKMNYASPSNFFSKLITPWQTPFGYITEEPCQAPPLTQVMLSTFFWPLSCKWTRQEQSHTNLSWYLLHIGKHEPQRFSILFIEQQVVLGGLFVLICQII